jgi:activator of HSP90 ATPase
MKNAFTISAAFPVPPATVYAAWLNSRRHSLMTGGTAICSARVGGAFSAWDGYISGKNIELEPDRRIVQSWRTTEFAENDMDSRLEIIIAATKRGCILTLKHSNIPPGQAEEYRQGWKKHYFGPMLKYLISKNSPKKGR